jgi:electron transport complex protein RnfB
VAEALALAAALLEVLPQTQCRRCGYADCRAYADAIAAGDADVNRCAPGGAEGVARLARIAGRPVVALDAECGAESPRRLAVIDEAACIGCALCLKACPTDAILGAGKRMHTVIEAPCTGCELCLPVCPVDCISLVDASAGLTGWRAWSPAQAAVARRRYDAHRQRHQP